MRRILSLFFLFAVLPPAFGGVIAPSRKWERTELRVCWATPAAYAALIRPEKRTAFHAKAAEGTATGFAAEKSVIRETIEGNFVGADLGIAFTGWEPCPATARGLAEIEFMILLGESGAPLFTGRGSTSVGDSDPETDPFNPILPPNSIRPEIRRKAGRERPPSFIAMEFPTGESLLQIARADAVRMIALHEFGHAAGLGHEDDHPGNPETLNSPLVRALGHRLGDAFEARAGFDRQSVMSYQYLANAFARLGTDVLVLGSRGELLPVRPRARAPEIEAEIAELFRGTSDPTPAIWADRSVLASTTEGYRVVPALSRGDRESIRALYRLSSKQ